MESRNLLSYWDWIVLAVYFVGMLVLGSVFARRQTTADHYFTAGRRIPGWAAGLSLFATLLSSFVFIAFPGQTYSKNWEVLVQQFSTPIVIFLVAVFAIPIYRRAVRISAYEYLERRFGFGARVYGTLGFLGGHFTKIAIVMSTMAIALNGITGWNIDAILIGLGLVTIVYTFFGGMEGVIWTDVVQGILMILSGVVVIVFLMFIATPEGPGALLSVAIRDNKFQLVNPRFSMTDETFWVILWMGIFHFATRYGTDQTMVQRYLTATTLREARKGIFVSLAACMFIWIAFPFIGTLLYSFYTLHPERLGPDIIKGDQVFPYFIGKELPPGVTGLVLAGLVAATMSTLSSDLNSFSACVVSDFYDRIARKRTEFSRLVVSKLTVMVTGAGAVGIAIWVSRHEGGIMGFVLEAWALLGAVLGGGILAAFILGFFFPRTDRRALYPALGVGLVLVLWCVLTQKGWLDLPARFDAFEYHWHTWWLAGFSNILVFTLSLALTAALPARAPAPRELTAYAENPEQDAHAPERAMG